MKNTKKQIKEITFTPFITKLITPSAELIGNELKVYLKNKIDTWKEKKRNNNIIGHIQKAQSQIPIDAHSIKIDENNIPQIELFQEWIDYAQDINPDDELLGQMWQKILVSIAKGDKSLKLLINKLKNLSTDEALLIIKLQNKIKLKTNSDKELFLLSSLNDKGFVLKSYKHLIYNIIIFVIFLITFSIIFAYYETKMNTVDNPTLLISAIVGIVIFSSFFTLVFEKFNFSATWSLTWLGKEIIKYLPKDYIDKQKSTKSEERNE